MPFWLPKGTVLLKLIEAEVREQLAKRGYDEIKTPRDPRRGALAPLRPLGQLPREHVLRRALRARPRRGRPALRAEADELPRRLPRLRLSAPLLPRPAAAARRVRRRLPLRARGRAARPAPGPRLHPGRRPRLLHAGPGRATRSTRSARRSTSSTRMFGFDDVRVELSTRPEKSIGTDEQWDARRAALREALDAPGPRVRGEPRRRRLLRPEDRLPRHRRARPLVAVRHLPARLHDAGALRPRPTRASRQRQRTAGDDPPRPARLDGALRRHPDRALRRPLPRSGSRPMQAAVLPVADRHNDAAARRSRALRARRARRGSTIARSRSAARSATPSWRRCRTCSSSATARRRRAGRGPLARGRRPRASSAPTISRGSPSGRSAGAVARYAHRVYTPSRCKLTQTTSRR